MGIFFVRSSPIFLIDPLHYQYHIRSLSSFICVNDVMFFNNYVHLTEGTKALSTCLKNSDFISEAQLSTFVGHIDLCMSHFTC